MRFGGGFGPGNADVGQPGGIKGQKLLALIPGNHGKPQLGHKISKTAARLHAGNSHRGGVKRGEHGLSFRVSSTAVMRGICTITSLDPFTRTAMISKMNGFDIWHQDL
jgi:hypothetical protein